MSSKAKNIKGVFREVIRQIPWISDLYNHHWGFYLNPNAYQGVFSSFQDALDAIPQHYRSTYNLPELHRYPEEMSNLVQTATRLNPQDYPVLFWLNSILKDNSTLLDLGGKAGQSFYSYQNYLSYGKELRWIVCDLPAAVEAGQKLAEKLESKNISFKTNWSNIDELNILLTCGTLQYLEQPLAEIIKSLSSRPQHVLVHRVPCYDGEQYITLQNLIASIVPYKIQNRQQLIDSITDLGYELIDSWSNNRTCSIPFHPERFVKGYYGFYFRDKEKLSHYKKQE
ncbi:MAG: methyltransferase, TIGR04325 family [Cyanobacteriota bacterium]|nr:methyltransferase, TIGR04325 family [Cyanobacteriota bacterium]